MILQCSVWCAGAQRLPWYLNLSAADSVETKSSNSICKAVCTLKRAAKN